MVLSLTAPIGSNFLQDFSGQNETNLNIIDAYAGPCLTSDPLQSFSPPLSAVTTPPTLGTGGYSTAHFYRIFDQLFMWGEFRFGSSGINAGSGIYFLTLPFDVSTLLGGTTVTGEAPIIGVGSTYDANLNAGRLPLTVHLRAANQIHFGVRMNSGSGIRELRHTDIITWDTLDGVSWCGRVKRVS